jgi:Outer membrane protein
VVHIFCPSGVRALLLAVALAGASAATAEAATPLTLGAATQLALHHQPLLAEQDADAAAARQRAVAALQLPDPELKLQVMDLPVDTGESFSPTRDNFTIYSAGVMQRFPLPGKRRLRSRRETLDAQMSEATRAALQRKIARDAGLAWVDVWAAQQGTALVEAQIVQARQQQQDAAIRYRSGGDGNAAQLLAARVAVQQFEDRRDATVQQLEAARARLSRWIGATAAQRPLPPSLPMQTAPPPLGMLMTALPQQPALRAAGRAVARADTGIALARENYKPDWSLEVDYGYRPRYSDFITLTTRIGLPLLPGDRQDRDLSAARHEAEAADARLDDLQRQLAAELRSADSQWHTAQARLMRYDDGILPQTQARVAAALADYRSGNGTLEAVLDARQAQLTAQLQRLRLAAQATQLRLTLQYFEIQPPAPGAGQE